MIDPHDFPPPRICVGHEDYICNVSLEGAHPNRKRCEKCAYEYRKEVKRRQRNERKARGDCAVLGCQNKPEKGFVTCYDHLLIEREKYDELKARGLCVVPGCNYKP